jgi:hypothetical protein
MNSLKDKALINSKRDNQRFLKNQQKIKAKGQKQNIKLDVRNV